MPLGLIPKPVAHRLDGPPLLQRRPDVAHDGADLDLGEPLVLVCVVLPDALRVLVPSIRDLGEERLAAAPIEAEGGVDVAASPAAEARGLRHEDLEVPDAEHVLVAGLAALDA